MIQHSCALNQVTYRGGGLSLRVLIDFFARRNPIQELKDMLLVYPHFKKMPNYSTASLLDKKIYAIIREMEIKQMKRMRAYIDIEEEYYQTGKLKQ